MTEIKVEKKKRPIWPWILAVVLVGAIIWIIADDDDGYGEEMSTVQTEESYDDTQSSNEYNTKEDSGSSGAIASYVNYIDKNGHQITKSHKHSHKALTHLDKAITSVAKDANVEISQGEINNLKEKADQLKEDRSSTEHAAILAGAFTSAAKVINDIQKKQYPEMNKEVEALMQTAKNVNPGEMVTNQKSGVKDFFQQSANVLQSMHNKTAVSMK